MARCRSNPSPGHVVVSLDKGFTMVISAWLLRPSTKVSGQEFEEICVNIGSLETPKYARISPNTNYGSYRNEKYADHRLLASDAAVTEG